MNEKLSVAERFYAPITEGEVSGIEGWEPESFRPSNGRVLGQAPRFGRPDHGFLRAS